MKEKSKIYTAADFKRYHAGTMPAGEMHELEKAALEDPFLEDALEGYVYASTFETDIEELHHRLEQKRKKNKAFVGSFTRGNWWRIAAAVIIVTGAAFFFLRVNMREKDNLVATNKTGPSPEFSDTGLVLQSSTGNAGSDSTNADNNIASSVQQEDMRLPRGEVQDRNVNPQGPGTRDKPSYLPRLKSSSDSSYVAELNVESDAIAPDGNTSKEMMQNESRKLAAPPPVTLSTPDNEAVSDAEKDRRPVMRDTNSKEPDVDSKSIALKKQTLPITNGKESKLEEVVVTGYSSQRKKSVTGAVSTESNSKSPVSTPAPGGPFARGGKEQFEAYLKNNTAVLYDSNGVVLTGEVSLSFTVNRKGKPGNIRVVKSTCLACEKEAIKLLENGPLWPGKQLKKSTVIIKF